MKLFGKKKQSPVMPSPTERVMKLSSQGLSEPEIIETLRGEGYTPIQVDNAMREALRGVAAGTGVQPARPSQRFAPPPREYGPPAKREYAPPPRKPEPEYEEEFELPEEPEEEPASYPRREPRAAEPARPGIPEPPVDFEEFKRANKELALPEIPGREEEEVPGEEEEELKPIPRFASRDRTRGDVRQEKRRIIEELTEGVVEEKWQDFRKRIDEMNDRFQQLSQRISVLEQKIGLVQGEKKNDLIEIEGKIDTYKQSIDEIQARMESVERAMKDNLTPMMQTLRSLSETIKSLKQKRD